MKSKDLQNVVLSKYIAGDYPRKIFHDLHGQLGLYTIQRWCKMIDDRGSINLSKPPGAVRAVRTKTTIQKAKHRLNRKKRISQRISAKELSISKTTARRTLVDDI